MCLFLLLFPIFWEVGHRGSCCDLCQRVFCLFSSRSFIVSGFTFRSLIHFEFIFVYGVRKCSRFIFFFFLQVVDQFSQHHLLKRLSFLLCIFLPPLSKIRCHRFVDLSLGFLFCSFDLYFCFCASTILSWWLWLCSRVWSQTGWFLQFHSSFSRLLWLFEVFCISIRIVKLFVLVLWKIPLVAW